MSDKVLSGRVLGEDRVCSAATSRSQRSSGTFPHYKMDHPRRGVAAIFNHESFENCGISERKGSEKDVESLCRTFARLGFEVETFCDLTFREIESTLEDLSQRDHSKSDCFVCVFMSHGLEGKLRSRDVVFDVNCLWDCFTSEHAPTLANKPKIFIIQACQGHGRQCGVRVTGEAVQDSSRFDERVTLVPGYILPSTPDFLVALSTIPGFVSWRSPQNGSWYIQVLCDHLDRQGFEQDLVTLLTHVGREIAVEYSVLDMEDLSKMYKKQLPSVISFLVKKVQFTRKGSKSGGNSSKRKFMVCFRDSSDDGVSDKGERNINNGSPKRRKIEGAKSTV